MSSISLAALAVSLAFQRHDAVITIIKNQQHRESIIHGKSAGHVMTAGHTRYCADMSRPDMSRS
jgi:3-hydroxyisobutyrate dehydrogenase-like beta-hydroxyacid dehydrogenase